ncbi:DUF6215 domain-containing protein [Streptomyces phaeofaciens]
MAHMVDEVVEPEKGMSTGAQVVAAVVMVAGVAGLMWALAGALPQNTADDRPPATCSSTRSASPSARHVSGAQLCTALNRADLSSLLGTPQEHARTATGHDLPFEAPDGTRHSNPEATVTFDTYSVRISALYDNLPVADMARLLDGAAQPRTVLGHPAALYSDRTIALTLDLGSGKADTGPGGIARSMLVAQDAKDGGDSYEIVIWRQDDVVPDDAALLRVVETVLPDLPGWTTA